MDLYHDQSVAMFRASMDIPNFDPDLLAVIQHNQLWTYNSVKSILVKSNLWNFQDRTGNSLLHYAAKYNNKMIVQFLIESGSNIETQNNLGKTPLLVAVENNSCKAIETLLLSGASIYVSDFSGKNSLQWIFRTKNIDKEILEIVLEKLQTDYHHDFELIGIVLSKIGCTLYDVLTMKNLVVTTTMLDHGCSVHARSEEYQTVLHRAVQLVDVDHVKLFFWYNADPNAVDHMHRTPLAYLYQHDQIHSDRHLQILKMLIARNAAIITTVDILCWRQVDSILQYGNRDAIEIILHAKLDLNQKDENGYENDTAIHILAKNRTPDALKALDNYSFDKDIRKAHLKTALWVAADCGNASVMEYLLKRGLDVNAVDSDGSSVLHRAIHAYTQNFMEPQYKECVEILLYYGANIQKRSEVLLSVLEICLQKPGCTIMIIIMIAHLVVKEALGIPITEYIRNVIDSDVQLQRKYEYYQQRLQIVVYNSETMRDLLIANERKFKKYICDEMWVLELQKWLVDKEEDHSFYLETMLHRRVQKAIQMIELKKENVFRVCRFMEIDYASFHLVVDKVIFYLTEGAMEILSEVNL